MHICPLSLLFKYFNNFLNFVQNQIFGLYGETRHVKQLHLIQIVWKHSKTTFSCLCSHVVLFTVSILYLAHSMCKENVFWPNFSPKLGHFGGHFEFYGSNLKSEFKNGFLDPKNILVEDSHFKIGNILCKKYIFHIFDKKRRPSWILVKTAPLGPVFATGTLKFRN